MANTEKIAVSSEINERILHECFNLYTDKRYGLVPLAKQFNLDISPPSKQIVVLLVGNHSAGKSTFINWYVGDKIQKEGVAVETQGFTFVQHGRRRDTLLADAAMLSMPRFRELRIIEGLLNFVTMEISPSQKRKFKLVTFIDSPGLVDGGLKYPFDVDTALPLLGRLADLVFVFFDPIGQALCKRTLEIIRRISVARNDGIFFFLSKVDEAGSHSDRQKVLIQIVQELCSSADFNRQGFEIKGIYVPDKARITDCLNQIEEACEQIEKAVSFTVQKTLSRLEQDCLRLDQNISSLAEQNQFNLNYFSLICLGLSILFVALAKYKSLMEINGGVDSEFQMFCLLLAIITFILFFNFSNCKSLFYWNSRLNISRMRGIVNKALQKKESLYIEYLEQSIL